MTSFLPSILVLGIAAFFALKLVSWRQTSNEYKAERIVAARALGFATAIQTGHFAEELATGFHVRFPALFGLEPIPLMAFVAFNVVWIVIWVAAIPMLRSARSPAFFAAWFLAIAGMLNGLAHPVMAAASGGYFPGLITAPLIGLVSIYLWRCLRSATVSNCSNPPAGGFFE